MINRQRLTRIHTPKPEETTRIFEIKDREGRALSYLVRAVDTNEAVFFALSLLGYDVVGLAQTTAECIEERAWSVVEYDSNKQMPFLIAAKDREEASVLALSLLGYSVFAID